MTWFKRWAGSYTFLSCSYWGRQYDSALKRKLGVGFERTVFVHRRGTVSFFVRKEELDALGEQLAKRSVEDPSFAARHCQELKANSDVLLEIMESLRRHIPSTEEYTVFLNAFERHLALHVFVKKTVDYLPPEALHSLLPIFRDARVYSEPVYSETERFFRDVTRDIASHEGVDAGLLTCLTSEEFEAYVQRRILPRAATLRERFECSTLLFENGERRIIVGAGADAIEQKIVAGHKNLHGTCAYGGTVRGTCRIILDPHADATFDPGDILVTGQTRPEFLKFMKKASAIVTDTGGMLCHAAIASRELKIPCVVGTQTATRILKDGDTIEVDATSGIVRKVS
jgi:phosphohistidine swiveling domain-containing protein